MDASDTLRIGLSNFIVVMLLVGWIPALIARSKGRSFLLWWGYGGALFIVALIHSLCISDRGARQFKEAMATVNRCDGCGAHRSLLHLEKVEGRGFLCPQCRSCANNPLPPATPTGQA